MAGQSHVYKGNKAKIFVSCEDAAQRGGIVPTPGAPVSIKLMDDSIASCDYETVMGIAAPACPDGWIGPDSANCFKMVDEPASNEEASKICNEMGSDLIGLDLVSIEKHPIFIACFHCLSNFQSSNQEFILKEINRNLARRRAPTHPGYIHVGTYITKSSYQYYNRRGTRV